MHPRLRSTLTHVLQLLGPDRVARAEPIFRQPHTCSTCFLYEALGTTWLDEAWDEAKHLGFNWYEFQQTLGAYDAAWTSRGCRERAEYFAAGLECSRAELRTLTAQFHQLVLDWLDVHDVQPEVACAEA